MWWRRSGEWRWPPAIPGRRSRGYAKDQKRLLSKWGNREARQVCVVSDNLLTSTFWAFAAIAAADFDPAGPLMFLSRGNRSVLVGTFQAWAAPRAKPWKRCHIQGQRQLMSIALKVSSLSDKDL
jgi:hypothetical protein